MARLLPRTAAKPRLAGHRRRASQSQGPDRRPAQRSWRGPRPYPHRLRPWLSVHRCGSIDRRRAGVPVSVRSDARTSAAKSRFINGPLGGQFAIGASRGQIGRGGELAHGSSHYQPPTAAPVSRGLFGSQVSPRRTRRLRIEVSWQTGKDGGLSKRMTETGFA